MQAEETRMLQAAADFWRDFEAKAQPRWLTFLGPVGCGKTLLARALWRCYQKERVSAVVLPSGEIIYPGQFCWWPEIAAALSANAGYVTCHDLGQEAFVVLDEIGADRDLNGHVKDYLARILGARVGKWTLITSNRGLQQVADEIDPRVSSRMVRDGSVVVEMDLEDFCAWKVRGIKHAR